MGKTDAFSLLYDRYRPLIEASVVRFSNRFQGELSEEYSELEEEAVIALYRAAVSYEPGRHSTFGLYARVCIRNRLISCIRKHAKRLLGEAAATEPMCGCPLRAIRPPIPKMPACQERLTTDGWSSFCQHWHRLSGTCSASMCWGTPAKRSQDNCPSPRNPLKTQFTVSVKN